jgi:hypothetical protein
VGALSFGPNAIPYALGAVLQDRANFFMDDTNISDKVKDKDSTPFPPMRSNTPPNALPLSSVDEIPPAGYD